MRGLMERIWRLSSVSDAPKTQGSTAPTTRHRPIQVPSNRRAISAEGLIRSPPKGSKPVTNTVEICLLMFRMDYSAGTKRPH
jgi:hypothetical protein